MTTQESPGRKRFEATVDDYFRRRPSEDNVSAKKALLMLYDFIAKKAEEAAGLERGSPQWATRFFQVQQTICWSPLRIFLRQLTEDPAAAIRASAKGEICDRTAGKEYWGDPEVGLIGEANLPLMLSGASMAIQDELGREPAIAESMSLWQISGQVTRFTPQLGVRSIEPPTE